MRTHKIVASLLIFLALAINALAQSGNMVKGTVVDNGGEPVIGAQVRWKDTKVITVTNIDGEFSIPRDTKVKTLVISYIGYKTQELTVKGSTVQVTMEDDAQSLDELVVVGYGIQKKSSITGSVETVKAEDLLMVPTTNLDQSLQGQVAGLQVMQSSGDPSTAREAAMSIRGINNAPLLVIDGVPRFGTNTSDGETRLSDLNPDDIESITVLKDAAAAAVYGARAANGVILVQTKRAKDNGKIKIDYRGQYNLQQATRLPEFLDAYEFAKLRNTAVANSPATTVEPYTDEQLEQIRTHSNPNVYGNESILDYLDKTGFSTTHSMSASGGNEFVRYYLSFGYADSKGLYSGVKRDRLNYSGKLDATLAKGLTLSLDYIGSNSTSKNSSYTTVDAAYAFSPVQVLRFTDGSLASANGNNPLINIYGIGGYIKDNSRNSTINARLTYEVPFLKGLSVYASGTFDDNHRIETKFDKPVTLYLYDEKTNTFSADRNTLYPSAKVTQAQTDRFFTSQLYELGLNFNKTFAKKHD
ncbi:SusC/RagA family TonB-linked outer membrane protein, partial [Hallella bergensis]|uniref:SusC/RagA family TonB-linked outer membrane protein n=1 Tax=Hallella bergensis TaxID=242750 RepID=UPI0023F0BC4E